MAPSGGPWRSRTWRLPAEGPGGVDALAFNGFTSGCGLCGDDEASLLVLWKGPTVVWLSPPGGPKTVAATIGRAHGPERQGSHSFAGAVVLSARPLPRVFGIVALLADGSARLLQCQEDGSAQEAALACEAEGAAVVGAWPLGPSGLLVLPSCGLPELADLGASGKPRSRRLAGGLPQPLASVPACAMRLLDSGDALLAAVGHLPSKDPQVRAKGAAAAPAPSATLLRLWVLRSGEVASADELLLSAADLVVDAPQAGRSKGAGEAAALPDVVAIALGASGSSAAVLFASGAVLAASTPGDARWVLGRRLVPGHTADLRLCAIGGFDEALAPLAPTGGARQVPCGLHAWGGDSVSAIFPGSVAENAFQAADLVTMSLPDLRLARGEPYRAVVPPPASIAACGSAGARLAFMACSGSGASATVSLGLLTWEAAGAAPAMGTAPTAALALPAEGVVHRFRRLVATQDLPTFVEGVLSFDPFEGAGARDGDVAFGCEQLRKLLELAQSRLQAVLRAVGAPDAAPAAPGGGGARGGGEADGWDFDISGGEAAAPPEVDGWDDDLDLDAAAAPASGPPRAADEACSLPAEDLQQLRHLLERSGFQLGRLEVFARAHRESSAGSPCSLSWRFFREVDRDSLKGLARQMAAERCLPVLEALFDAHATDLAPSWADILDALPETVAPAEVRRLLPAPAQNRRATTWVRPPMADAVAWYVARAARIVDLTGLTGEALDLLRHGICAAIGGDWPAADGALAAEHLPKAPAAVLWENSEVRQLYGMFRLCAEYAKYGHAMMEEMYAQGDEASEVLPLAAFCSLAPAARAQLALRKTGPGSVAADVRDWTAAISVEHCGLDAVQASSSPAAGRGPLAEAAEAACGQSVENAIMEAVIARVNLSGWDPASFGMVAEVVAASSPTLPASMRIIRSQLTMLEFILGALYSDDQRCRAMDIFSSADEMYRYIPQPEAGSGLHGVDAERWAVLQQQCDELQQHLNCIEVLIKYKIQLSLSFADLRRGCSNEPMAVRSLWSLFRVLGGSYRPAQEWRRFQQELFYLHRFAFAAVSEHAVSEMFVQVLIDQEHFDAMSTFTRECWAASCGGLAVAGSLVKMAQELVNASPALRHQSLEKAKRVLRCIPNIDGELSDLAQSELDFIKACELLHDLVRRQPPRGLFATRLAEDLRKGAMNLTHALHQPGAGAGGGCGSSEPEVTTLGAASGLFSTLIEGWSGASGADGFRFDAPLQLRLQLHQPLRVVADLLQFNPPVLLETEDLHKFCGFLGLAPSSPRWAEVMAMCGAANLLCGVRSEALAVTEKLLANAHPAAWKLALALASTSAGASPQPAATAACGMALDQGSDLLADAAKVCPADELPELLNAFYRGPPGGALGGAPDAAPAPGEAAPRAERDDARSYTAASGKRSSALCVAAHAALGFAGGLVSEPGWRGLRLWEGADGEAWRSDEARRRWGEELLPYDADTAVALLDAAGAELPAPASSRARSAASEARRAAAAERIAKAKAEKAAAAVAAAAEGGGAARTLGSVQRLFAAAEPAAAAPPEARAEEARPAGEPQQFFIGEGLDAAPAANGPAPSASPAARRPPAPAQAPEEATLDELFGAWDAMPAAGPAPPAAAAAALAALEDPDSAFPEQEREVYRSMLPSLTAARSIRAIVVRVLRSLEERGAAEGARSEDLSRRVLLCRRLLSMCEEVDAQNCPELELGGAGAPSSTLLAVHRACAGFHSMLGREGAGLAEDIFRCAESDLAAAPQMVQAVAGVGALADLGVTPSAVAARAARAVAVQGAGVAERLAVLVPWLSREDAARLLAGVVNSPEVALAQQFEVLAQLRTATAEDVSMGAPGAAMLRSALSQAEALTLLQAAFESSVGQQPAPEVLAAPRELRVDASVSPDVARAGWLEAISRFAREEEGSPLRRFGDIAEVVLQLHPEPA